MSLMLSGVDKRTGQRLDDRQIRDETITFLIAGHETTSGLLSFATYALLNNPDVLEKCYAEVDRVLGPDLSVKPTYAQVNQLPYIAQSPRRRRCGCGRPRRPSSGRSRTP